MAVSAEMGVGIRVGLLEKSLKRFDAAVEEGTAKIVDLIMEKVMGGRPVNIIDRDLRARTWFLVSDSFRRQDRQEQLKQYGVNVRQSR